MSGSDEELYVCGACFSDSGLKAFVATNVQACECSFCHDKGNQPIAAPLGDVAKHLNTCLYREYEDAANELPWVGAEGGYLGKQWDTYDLLVEEVELDLPRDIEGNLFCQLLRRIDDNTWCEANGLGLNPQELAESSWERFSDVVTHDRRFFFMAFRRDPHDAQVFSPGETLRAIVGYAQEIGLLECVPQGTFIFRARFEKPGVCFQTVPEIGPPPVEEAIQSNRMSPAGIVMFYGAEDSDTALKETATKAGRFAVGRFETLRPSRVLNLTSIPELPSLFEPGSGVASKRRMLKFLGHVADQISQPISRDGREHVEYVPTQVVTEFVRSLPTEDGERIDGIKYRSSANSEHASYVLFATQEEIVDSGRESRGKEKWLGLVEVDHYFFRPLQRNSKVGLSSVVGQMLELPISFLRRFTRRLGHDL